MDHLVDLLQELKFLNCFNGIFSIVILLMEDQLIEKPKAKKVNPWLTHVSQIREKNSDKSYKEIQLAKETYKPIEKKI